MQAPSDHQYFLPGELRIVARVGCRVKAVAEFAQDGARPTRSALASAGTRRHNRALPDDKASCAARRRREKGDVESASQRSHRGEVAERPKAPHC